MFRMEALDARERLGAPALLLGGIAASFVGSGT
jgi:hypothetical protein